MVISIYRQIPRSAVPKLVVKRDCATLNPVPWRLYFYALECMWALQRQQNRYKDSSQVLMSTRLRYGFDNLKLNSNTLELCMLDWNHDRYNDVFFVCCKQKSVRSTYCTTSVRFSFIKLFISLKLFVWHWSRRIVRMESAGKRAAIYRKNPSRDWLKKRPMRESALVHNL